MGNCSQSQTKSHSFKAIDSRNSVGVRPQTGVDEDSSYNCNGSNLKCHLLVGWSKLPGTIENIDEGIKDERNIWVLDDEDKEIIYFSGVIEVHTILPHLAPTIKPISKEIIGGLLSRFFGFIDRETSHSDRNNSQYCSWNNECEEYRPTISQ